MKTIILRFGELYLKGKNQIIFRKTLVRNIKKSLNGIDFILEKLWGRYIVKVEKKDLEKTCEKLQKVFGLVSISVSIEVNATILDISKEISNIKIKSGSFRISVNRADKEFPIKSIDLERKLGEIILENNSQLKVKLNNPEHDIKIDIRENKKAYIFTEELECAGGLPYGTAGKGLLLLSGGIDSPVACFQMAKRGLEIKCLHFTSFPYTSEQAKQKVIKLTQILSDYCPNLKLFIVNITKIQEEIHKNCAPELMITILRRFMYRIAEEITQKHKIGSIVTGESLSQVASQTLESLTVIEEVLSKKVIVFRPLVAFDKIETIKIAEKIGTYETSILPFEDCCTVFLPTNPIIKPNLIKVLKEEEKLEVEKLTSEAINEIEEIRI